MKKIFLMMALMLTAAIPMALTGCSSDDEPSNAAAIVGSWQLTAIDSDFWAEYSSWEIGDVITFSADGSYSLSSNHSYTESGKWSLSGNELKLYDITSSDDTINLPATVTCAISGDVMTLYLSVLDVTLHFKRI